MTEQSASFVEQSSKIKMRIKAALEIATVLSIIFLFTWFAPDSHALIEKYRGLIIAFFAFSLIYLAYISPCLIFKDALPVRGLGPWKSLFIRTDNFKAALNGYGSISLIGTCVIFGFTFLHKPDFIDHINWSAFFLKLIFYITSATVQELLFISWLLMRLRTVLKDDMRNQSENKRFQICAVAATIAFLIHAPNLPVMCICLVTGFAVIWVSCSTPNLFLAASCHALIGTLLHRVAGIQVKIGPHYMKNDFHFLRTLFPIAKKVIGDLF